MTFIKVRLGWQRLVKVVTDPGGRFPYIYLPIEDIMEELGHQNATLDVLKLDVENAEWDVFEKHIFQVKNKILDKHVWSKGFLCTLIMLYHSAALIKI